MLGRLAASGVALGLALVGAGAIAAPGPSSGQYGLATDDPTALGYVRALGARDVVVGLLLARSLVRGERRTVAATLGIGSLIALGDFLVVARARGLGTHLAVHAVGGIGMLVARALLLAEPTDDGPERIAAP